MKMILKLGLAEIQFNCPETSFRQKVKVFLKRQFLNV